MVRMVNIGKKPAVDRMARAEGFIRLNPETLRRIEEGKVPKGDVLTVAETAGIMAVKQTPKLIPLTHPIPITGVDVSFEFMKDGIRTKVKVDSTGQTGVEMEALAGVSGALLTVWDMVKSLEKDESGQYPTTVITDVNVSEKVKG